MKLFEISKVKMVFSGKTLSLNGRKQIIRTKSFETNQVQIPKSSKWLGICTLKDYASNIKWPDNCTQQKAHTHTHTLHSSQWKSHSCAEHQALFRILKIKNHSVQIYPISQWFPHLLSNKVWTYIEKDEKQDIDIIPRIIISHFDF